MGEIRDGRSILLPKPGVDVLVNDIELYIVRRVPGGFEVEPYPESHHER